MVSGRVFHWDVTFPQKDDWPKAEWRKGILQSPIEHIRDDLMETYSAEVNKGF